MKSDTLQSADWELFQRPAVSGNGGVAPSARMRVLIVEGNPSDTRLIHKLLAAAGSFEMRSVQTLSAALEQLSGNPPNLVLLNLELPDSQGIETLRRVVAAAPDVAIVVLSAQEHDPLAMRAVQTGAQDYLVKGHVDGLLLARVARLAVERQRLVSELSRRQTEQFDLKDQFLSHISHELRSPLAAIDQFANLLLDDFAGPLSAEQREYLEVLVRNARQLSRMIDDLLAMVRAQSGKLRVEPIPFSMTRLIEETLQTLGPRAEAKQVALRAEFPPEVPVVWADPQRTCEVLTNLIENAIKFTPEKGSVTVTARPFAAHSAFVEVAVADTGCGIAADDLDKVFDRLFQVSRKGGPQKGLGLGLYISRELVQRQGGRIWAESAVDGGSTFRLLLPAHTVVGELYSELGRKTPPAGPLSLIELSVHSLRGNRAVPLDPVTLESLREFVTGCVRPEVDVVLPPVESGRDAASLFVLAATEPAGAEAVQKRLLGGLGEPDQKLGTEVTLTSTATPVALPFGWAHWPPEQRMQAVAAQVEQMIERRRTPSAAGPHLGSEDAAGPQVPVGS